MVTPASIILDCLLSVFKRVQGWEIAPPDGGTLLSCHTFSMRFFQDCFAPRRKNGFRNDNKFSFIFNFLRFLITPMTCEK